MKKPSKRALKTASKVEVAQRNLEDILKADRWDWRAGSVNSREDSNRQSRGQLVEVNIGMQPLCSLISGVASCDSMTAGVQLVSVHLSQTLQRSYREVARGVCRDVATLAML